MTGQLTGPSQFAHRLLVVQQDLNYSQAMRVSQGPQTVGGLFHNLQG